MFYEILQTHEGSLVASGEMNNLIPFLEMLSMLESFKVVSLFLHWKFCYKNVLELGLILNPEKWAICLDEIFFGEQ